MKAFRLKKRFRGSEYFDYFEAHDITEVASGDEIARLIGTDFGGHDSCHFLVNKEELQSFVDWCQGVIDNSK